MTITTKIILRELSLHCIIGIDPAEAHIKQRVLIDADITIQYAPEKDAAPTYDYSAAADALRELAQTPVKLLETLAHDAAARLLAQSPAAMSARVYARKPRVFADIESAGVEVIVNKNDG